MILKLTGQIPSLPNVPAPKLLELEKARHTFRAPKGGIEGDGRVYRGGQYITVVLMQSEQAKAKAALPSLIAAAGQREELLRALYEQNAALSKVPDLPVPLVPLASIEREMKAVLHEGYATSFRLGKRAAGNLSSPTPEEQHAVERLLTDERKYLRGFLSDMRQGSGKMSYARRMAMYASAIEEVYWLGWSLEMVRQGKRIRWVMDKAVENCASCRGLVGEYSAEEFKAKVVDKGLLPRSGKLSCTTNCHCHLEEA